jgi:signal peptidase I
VGDGHDALAEAELLCASCGAALPPTSKFCNKCGAAVGPAPEPEDPERSPEDAGPDILGANASAAPAEVAPAEVAKPQKPKWGVLRKVLALVISLVLLLVVLYAFGSRFVVQPYQVPSETMAPTLKAGERIIVNKLSYSSYRFGRPQPGDVVVFQAPPAWKADYESIRSHNTAVRWVQNALSVLGFVPPDEKVLVTRIIATGGQTVQCRRGTGLMVNGEPVTEAYLDPTTLGVDPSADPCLGPEFGPVTVPRGRLWVMDDNRTHAEDSRTHCAGLPADLKRGIFCTGDAASGTVPEENVLGRARRF